VAFSDPSFITPNEQNLSRDELYSEGMRKHVLFWQKIRELNLSDIFEIGIYLRCVNLLMHLFVHYFMASEHQCNILVLSFEVSFVTRIYE